MGNFNPSDGSSVNIKFHKSKTRNEKKTIKGVHEKSKSVPLSVVSSFTRVPSTWPPPPRKISSTEIRGGPRSGQLITSALSRCLIKSANEREFVALPRRRTAFFSASGAALVLFSFQHLPPPPSTDFPPFLNVNHRWPLNLRVIN